MTRTLGIAFMTLLVALVFAACGSGPRQTATEDTTALTNAAEIADTSLPAPDEFVEVDEIAEMTHSQAPVYPPDWMKQNIRGTTWVKALVSAKGSVIDAILYKSSGSALLDKSALDAGRECKFKPARKDGHPVAMWVVFSYEFNMPH